LALGAGLFNTTLVFDSDAEVDVQMASASVTAGWLINERWSVRASVGAILDGRIQTSVTESFDVGPGALAALGVDYRALLPQGAVPFVDLSMTIGASWTKTSQPGQPGRSYFASDARLGARVGWSILDTAFPYLTVRAFGGPVQWQMAGKDVVGTDLHHYQVALGTSGQIGPVALFVEWAPFGEQGLSSGLGIAF
jgi:hypothetical protein